MTRNVNEIVASQFPEFIRSTPGYAKFIEFIEDYYKWEETLDIIKENDIDETDFLDYYYGELARDFPELRSLNDAQQRLVLQKLSDIYKSKGTIDSYKALFGILFQVDVELFYPSTEIFKPSAAKWNREVSIRFEVLTGEVVTFENIPCVIQNDHRRYELDIVRIRKLTDTIYEAIYDIKFKLIIEAAATITTDEFTGNLVQGITSYEVRIPGSGFSVGDLFDINNNLGTGARVRIKRVHSGGGIRNIEIFQFGSGYQNSFFHILNPNSALIVNELNNLTITVTGTDPSSAAYPTDDSINRLGDDLQASKFDYTDIDPVIRADDYFEDNTYVGDQVAESSSISTQIQEENTNRAVIFFKLGYVHEYPGYFSTNVGFPDDSSYIQDSNYYQQYSYLVKSTKQFDEYKNPMFKLLHPAGLKAFAEYRIERNLEVLISIRNELNRFANNFLEVTDIEDAIIMTVIKSLEDSTEVLDDIALTLTKAQEDSVGVEDTQAKTITKNIYDSVTIIDNFDPESSLSSGIIDTYNDDVTINESLAKTQGKSLSDTISTIDSIILELAKYIGDDVTASDDLTLSIVKNISDTALAEEQLSKTVNKALDDYLGGVLDIGNGDVLLNGGDEFIAFSEIEEQISKTVYKSFADDVTVTDEITGIIRIILEEPSDSASVTEEFLMSYTKVVNEIIDIVEERVMSFTKNLIETVTVNETINKEYSKNNIADNVTSDNYGVVALEPFYYDISEGQYWEAGYFENEREIT